MCVVVRAASGVGRIRSGHSLMGYEVECTGEAYAIAETRMLRCDLFWPSARFGHGVPKQGFSRGNCTVLETRAA